jgi:hypothetical protein
MSWVPVLFLSTISIHYQNRIWSLEPLECSMAVHSLSSLTMMLSSNLHIVENYVWGIKCRNKLFCFNYPNVQQKLYLCIMRAFRDDLIEGTTWIAWGCKVILVGSNYNGKGKSIVQVTIIQVIYRISIYQKSHANKNKVTHIHNLLTKCGIIFSLVQYELWLWINDIVLQFTYGMCIWRWGCLWNCVPVQFVSFEFLGDGVEYYIAFCFFLVVGLNYLYVTVSN